MNFQEATTILENRFVSYWSNRTPIETENSRYKPITGTPWVRLGVYELDTERAELGDNPIRKRHFGVVLAEVFVPAFTGKTHSQLFTDAEQSPQYEHIPEITLGTSSTLTEGNVSGGAWYLKTITTPFNFDEIIN